jgi:hypothetical protein
MAADSSKIRDIILSVTGLSTSVSQLGVDLKKLNELLDKVSGAEKSATKATQDNVSAVKDLTNANQLHVKSLKDTIDATLIQKKRNEELTDSFTHIAGSLTAMASAAQSPIKAIASFGNIFKESMTNIGSFEYGIYKTSNALRMQSTEFQSSIGMQSHYKDMIDEVKNSTDKLSTPQVAEVMENLTGAFQGIVDSNIDDQFKSIATSIIGVAQSGEEAIKIVQSLSGVMGKYKEIQDLMADASKGKDIKSRASAYLMSGIINFDQYSKMMNMSQEKSQIGGGTAGRWESKEASVKELQYHKDYLNATNAAAIAMTDTAKSLADAGTKHANWFSNLDMASVALGLMGTAVTSTIPAVMAYGRVMAMRVQQETLSAGVTGVGPGSVGGVGGLGALGKMGGGLMAAGGAYGMYQATQMQSAGMAAGTMGLSAGMTTSGISTALGLGPAGWIALAVAAVAATGIYAYDKIEAKHTKRDARNKLKEAHDRGEIDDAEFMFQKHPEKRQAWRAQQAAKKQKEFEATPEGKFMAAQRTYELTKEMGERKASSYAGLSATYSAGFGGGAEIAKFKLQEADAIRNSLKLEKTQLGIMIDKQQEDAEEIANREKLKLTGEALELLNRDKAANETRLISIYEKQNDIAKQTYKSQMLVAESATSALTQKQKGFNLDEQIAKATMDVHQAMRIGPVQDIQDTMAVLGVISSEMKTSFEQEEEWKKSAAQETNSVRKAEMLGTAKEYHLQGLQKEAEYYKTSQNMREGYLDAFRSSMSATGGYAELVATTSSGVQNFEASQKYGGYMPGMKGIGAPGSYSVQSGLQFGVSPQEYARVAYTMNPNMPNPNTFFPGSLGRDSTQYRDMGSGTFSPPSLSGGSPFADAKHKLHVAGDAVGDLGGQFSVSDDGARLSNIPGSRRG